MSDHPHPARIILLLNVIWTLSHLPAVAQTPTPGSARPVTFSEQITVTATGVEAEASEVPAPTTVISRAEMDDSQKSAVSDLLRRVPGVTVMRSGNEGKAASVFTRGTNSSQTLILFDGVRLNSPYLGGYDLGLLTTSGLDRIEVVRGPYSALWGADAIGGVINAIPRTAGEGVSANLVAEAGGEGWRRFDGDVSFGTERFDGSLSALHRQGDGSHPNDDFETLQGLLNAGWSWDSGSRLSVVAQHLETETGIPFVTPGEPTLQRRQRADQRLIAVPFRWAVSESWQLRIIASEVTRTFRFSDPDDPWGLTESATNADTREARLTSTHLLSAHNLTWGGAWREDRVTDESSYGANLDDVSDRVVSAYVQDVWQMAPGVQLILGARWDDTETWGSQISPRAYLGWKPSRSTELRAGFGKAFRQPSLGELYFPFSGNPELEPETSRSFEVDVVWRSRNGRSRSYLNLFGTDLDNLIQFDFAAYTNRNIGTATIRGAELAVDTTLSQSVTQRAQVTWLDTEDDQGKALLRRPEISGSYTLTGTVGQRLRGDLTLIYTGDRWDVDPVTFERTEAGGFATVDLALGWQLIPELQLTLRAVNLLDRDYQEVLGYPSVGRRFVAGLRVGL